MGYDRLALKRAIDLSLNDDLIRQSRLYTRNLSGIREDLLGGLVEREHARRRDADTVLDQVIDGFSVFRRERGLLSDEFSWL